MPNTEIPVSEVRKRFAELIDNIADGPYTLVRHNDRVAVLGPVKDPAAELRAYVELFEEVGNLEQARQMLDLGLHTPERIREALRLYKEFYASGETFYWWTLEDVDLNQDTPVADIVGALYLSDSASLVQQAGQPLAAWAQVLRELQKEAAEKQQYDRLDFGESGVMEAILGLGLTPENFRSSARVLMSKGVKLSDVTEALGNDAIPVDILALGGAVSYRLNELLEEGMPREEAFQLIRDSGGEYWEAIDTARGFMSAGVTDYAEMRRLQDKKINLALALRAHAAGLTPAEWEPALDKLSRYSYERHGLLPFDVLIEAAEKGISLAHWDKSNIVEDPKSLKYYYGDKKAAALARHPWREIYPSHVIELAEAGVSPGYVAAVMPLILNQPGGVTLESSADDLVWRIKSLAEAGLKLPVIKVMTRRSRRSYVFQPTVEQTMKLAWLGITEAEARHFMDMSQDPEKWINDLRWYRESEDAAQMWLSARSDEDMAVLKTLGEALLLHSNRRWRNSRLDLLLEEATELVTKDKKLTFGHLMMLSGYLRYYLQEDSTFAVAQDLKNKIRSNEATTMDGALKLAKELDELIGELKKHKI